MNISTTNTNKESAFLSRPTDISPEMIGDRISEIVAALDRVDTAIAFENNFRRWNKAAIIGSTQGLIPNQSLIIATPPKPQDVLIPSNDVQPLVEPVNGTPSVPIKSLDDDKTEAMISASEETDNQSLTEDDLAAIKALLEDTTNNPASNSDKNVKPSTPEPALSLESDNNDEHIEALRRQIEAIQLPSDLNSDLFI